MLVLIKLNLLKDSKLIFQSKGNQVNSDHSEMNARLFKNWFLNHFINYLEEETIIVMNNANYHLVILNKFPSGNSSVKLLTG
jgi:hypothetical protein